MYVQTYTYVPAQTHKRLVFFADTWDRLTHGTD